MEGEKRRLHVQSDDDIQLLSFDTRSDADSRAGATGDEGFARAVEQALAAVDGITRVTANPLTGSFLIQFDPDRIDDRQILAELGRLGLQGDLVSSPATPERSGDSHAILALSTRVGAVIGKELAKAALGRAVGGSPLNLLLLLF